MRGESIPVDLSDPVEFWADVAAGRTDEKGVIENQQQPLSFTRSLAQSHRLHRGELDATLTSPQTLKLFRLLLP